MPFTKGHSVPQEWREKYRTLFKGKHFSPRTQFKKGDGAIERIKLICATCKKEIFKIPSKVGNYRTHYCSRLCHHKSIENDKHHMWKGNKVKYRALHAWVVYRLGKAKSCWICETKTAKRYHCANISGKYMRDLDDWLSLCVTCHNHCDKGKYPWFKLFREGPYAKIL